MALKITDIKSIINENNDQVLGFWWEDKYFFPIIKSKTKAQNKRENYRKTGKLIKSNIEDKIIYEKQIQK